MDQVIKTLVFLVLALNLQSCYGSSDAERLYDDLINGYNPLIRPVGNISDRLTIKLGLKLSQLIDVVSMSHVLHKYLPIGSNIEPQEPNHDHKHVGGTGVV